MAALSKSCQLPPLALWGGAEATIARVGDGYRNQLVETGHMDRLEDIGLIADLGIRTVRFPILWEMAAQSGLGRPDFSWADTRLERLRARDIDVVAGLLHHGSGPPCTSLNDPDFPKKFADYALCAAKRYPWIKQWTPINEPLTTARFSGLYGHWYPHARDERIFSRMLVNQCLATLLAMRAIRSVNPAATLLQTEDLGKIFSTAPLRHQALHENSRRWLSFDLLMGRVKGKHSFARRLLEQGIAELEMEMLASGEAKPAMLGINHYLTSERFLDHRINLYPGLMPGENGRDIYVDAEAVRVQRLHCRTGIASRLREASRRYRLPIVISEVHHGCTREEQLRWFTEVWKTASMLRDGEGIDIHAVTLWALFGNIDWRSLLTRKEGVYDAGAFDIRSPAPRPTILARAAAAYARGKAFDHPMLDNPGWWRRPARFYAWHKTGACAGEKDSRTLLITGATGTLGSAFARICGHRGMPYYLTRRTDLDISDAKSVALAIAVFKPWAVINAAGFVRTQDAAREQEACYRANALGAENLAHACARAGIPFVTFSSDLVFDGALGRPYKEGDHPNPSCIYGHSKAAAERRVLGAGGAALIIRTSAFFGPWDQHNFAWGILDQLARGAAARACRQNIVSPTYVPDLVHAVLDLLIDGETGIWHITNPGAISWHSFARRLAEGAGFDPALVLPIETRRPANTALTSQRGILLRPLEHAIDAYLCDYGGERGPASVTAIDIAAE